jgi:hypothetical protein
VGHGGQRGGSIIPWLSALTLLAFILRMVRLDFQPLWWDEGWSLYFATADIPSMISRTAIDIHPPSYYVLLHVWILIFGPSSISVRLLSVMVGTLSIPLIFVLGRRLFGTRVGTMAALTMAVAPFHIYYSQEARMYALVTFLVLCSMHLFLSLLERAETASSSRMHWLLYVVVTSLAMYTQYYAIFIPLSQTIFILIRFKRHRSLLGEWVGAQLILFLSYLPWILYAGGKLGGYVGEKMVKEGDVPLGVYAYVRQHLVAFSVGHLSESRAFLSWLALIFIALIMLGIVVHLRHRPPVEFASWRPVYAIAFALIYLLFPLSLGYLVNLRYPFASPGIQRLFLLSAPAFYILVALGLTWLWKKTHLWLACLFLIVVSALPLFDFYAVERYVGEDYRPLIERVQALARPDDVIVAIHPWQIGYFYAYYTGPLPSLYLTPKEATDVTSEEWAADPALMARDLDRLLLEHRFLWFPAHQALGRILESNAEGYLSQNYYLVFNQWFSESTRLSCYAAAEGLDLTTEQINFSDKVSLLGYGLSPGPVEAAWGALYLDLHWKITGELDGRHQIALRLTDEEGRVWAAQDREPVGGLRPFHEQPAGGELTDRHGLLIPAGTPPGFYQLRLGLYRLEDGQWLDLLGQDGAAQGVDAVLGAVEVLAPASPAPVGALFIQHAARADFAPDIRFLGYSLGSESFQAGDSLETTLFWQALADLYEDYHLSLQLQDDGGQNWASVEGPLTHASYPTSHWKQGQLVRGFQSLLVPARVPDGEYRLVLSLYRPADGQTLSLRRCGLNWGDSYLLGTIKVKGRPHQDQPPPSIGHPMSLRLGEAVHFLGYDLHLQQVRPGDSLHLTLYWQALSEMNTSYTVFTHLIDDQNRIWGQKDGIPGDGSVPTSSWLAGEYIIDEYEVPVRADAPPGTYLVEIGMYDLTTMIRLAVFDAQGTGIGDRILLEATPISVGP